MSKYRWKDLIQLNSKEDAYKSPLAIISHIDVNAFFAQVEEIRCGYTKDDPVVCVQWNSIIAVSYAARRYGISRMDSIQEALKKCDKIIPIHTAVFRKGEDFWQYHDGCGSWMDDKDKQLPNELYKVSLDPYRRESRKIFKIFSEYCDLAEKASVDEVFLDLGRLCLQKLMFSDMLIPQQFNDPSIQKIQSMFSNGDYVLESFLPAVPGALKALEFVGDAYNPNDHPLIMDWDDVLFALGSQITQEIRDEIKESLGYTTSCGIARTKNICKLASNFKKPDAQTIIKNDCVGEFLDNGKFEITSFWTLGGILGRELTQLLHLPTKGSIKDIRERWPTSSNELKRYLEKRNKSGPSSSIIDFSKIDFLADKLFNLVRGRHHLPVTPQTMVKSMMSNKNMNGGSCKSLIDCISWLEVFSGELASRIHELEQEYNRVVVPRTMSILIRTKTGESHSKSGGFINRDMKIESQALLKDAIKLVTELDSKFGKVKGPIFYPIQNINMSISNFDVFTSRKTVVDMFGSQAQIFEQRTQSTTPEIDIEAPHDFECKSCQMKFGNEKEFQEHRDYHIASNLSDMINGADENSKNLSVGEKRLLLSKRRTSPSETQSRKKTKLNRKENRASGNILAYFSKQ